MLIIEMLEREFGTLVAQRDCTSAEWAKPWVRETVRGKGGAGGWNVHSAEEASARCCDLGAVRCLGGLRANRDNARAWRLLWLWARLHRRGDGWVLLSRRVQQGRRRGKLLFGGWGGG